MDKQRKKELKKEYLRQELIKQSQSEDEIMANIARLKLGIPLASLDKNSLSKLNDADLEGKLLFKIEELISNRLKSDRSKYEVSIVESLSKEFKLIYYSDLLHGNIFNGGFESYYVNTAGCYILDTIEVLRILNYTEIINLLEKSIGLFIQMTKSDKGGYLSGDINFWKQNSEKIDNSYFQKQAKSLNFDMLDTEFYEIEHEFTKKRIEFIRSNLSNYEI